METKTVAMSIIGVMIAVILVTGVMTPVLGTLTEEQSANTTYTNDGPYFKIVGNDGVVHTISISLDDDVFKVTTDGTETRTLEMYVPQSTGTANAIAIGVYEAYDDSGVLTSQSGKLPTGRQTVNTLRTKALAGNTDVEAGTYQLWNFYQYTLMKIMGLTVMGNTDSQYIMGTGYISGSVPTHTGNTSNAYEKSVNYLSSESLFIENGWGSAAEYLGDTLIDDKKLIAGNTLGGNEIENVEGINTPINVPPSSSYILTISNTSDTWGFPITTGSSTSDGEGINDRTDVSTSTTKRQIVVGGRSTDTERAYIGLFCMRMNIAIGTDNLADGGRLAYVMTDIPPQTADYGYVISFDTTSGQTVISDVQVQDNGTLVSKMPSGTTLNSFWDFDTTTGVGPFGAYYVAINLSSGANSDDATETRLSTQKGEIAYRLNPNNLHQTLAGTTFDPTLYNVMIVIPTAYWYSDPATNKLYIGSSADKFDGITMAPYAHTYTIDPDVDTGNPPQQISYASTSLVMGEDSIVRLYANGDVMMIANDNASTIGTVSSGVDVSFTITNDVLTYGSDSQSGMLAYVSSEGEMVYAHNPTVTDDSQIIIGGITNDLETTGSETVTIGYAVSSIYDLLPGATVNVLNPTSSGTATYVSTNMTVNATEVGRDAYRIDSILFTSAWSDNSTSTATYTYFLAPAEVTVEGTTVTADGMLGTLISVIPLIVLVGIVMGVIGMYRLKQ